MSQIRSRAPQGEKGKSQPQKRLDKKDVSCYCLSTVLIRTHANADFGVLIKIDRKIEQIQALGVLRMIISGLGLVAVLWFGWKVCEHS